MCKYQIVTFDFLALTIVEVVSNFLKEKTLFAALAVTIEQQHESDVRKKKRKMWVLCWVSEVSALKGDLLKALIDVKTAELSVDLIAILSRLN